jgi:hypothetical protein
MASITALGEPSLSDVCTRNVALANKPEIFSVYPMNSTQSVTPSSRACCSNSPRTCPSPAICIRQSHPLRFNSTAALNSRSHRFTGTREPRPTMRTLPPTTCDTLRNCSKSRPLRTTNNRLGTKKLRDSRHVSAAVELLQIWLRGQHALTLPSNGPDSCLSKVKSPRTDPTATARVPRTPQYAAKFVKKVQEWTTSGSSCLTRRRNALSFAAEGILGKAYIGTSSARILGT